MDFDIEYKNIVFMIDDPMEKISCERWIYDLIWKRFIYFNFIYIAKLSIYQCL